MIEKHYACNNSQICMFRVQPSIKCKNDGCKYCVETEIYAEEKSDKISLE